MASSPLKLPIETVVMPRQFTEVFNGKIYVGKPDTDPTAAANRITVYQEAENGKLIPVAQPVAINAGGHPVINGQVVKLVVTQDYSIAVHDSQGAQAYYFPRCSGPYVLNIFHDQTLHGTGTESDKLGVQLSKNAGNLLEIRSDGLYYGATATDDLLNLYVDSANGDDKNPGTRGKPLKTLNRALTITPKNKSNTIHLRAGQTFILGVGAAVEGCTRTLIPYDDPWIDGDRVPDITPDNPGYDGPCAVGLARPVIKSRLNYGENNHIAYHYTFNVGAGGTLDCRGIIWDSIPDNDEQYPSGWGKSNHAPVYGSASGTVAFRGCQIVTKPHTDTIYRSVLVSNGSDGSYPALKFNRCQFLSGEYFINLGGVAANVTITDEWPSQFKIEYIRGNLVQSTNDGKLNGIVRGPNGEPRNLMINFVV